MHFNQVGLSLHGFFFMSKNNSLNLRPPKKIVAVKNEDLSVKSFHFAVVAPHIPNNTKRLKNKKKSNLTKSSSPTLKSTIYLQQWISKSRDPVMSVTLVTSSIKTSPRIHVKKTRNRMVGFVTEHMWLLDSSRKVEKVLMWICHWFMKHSVWKITEKVSL